MTDVKLIPVTCPQCGATLNLPDNSQRLFCMYCGSQIILGTGEAGGRTQCRICDGLGRVDVCRACQGSGRCRWATSSSGFRNDIFAMNFTSYCADGICSACGGTGRYNVGGCPGCNGTGKCPQCLGTGRCAACKGIGSIPNPNGQTTCSACGGTGIIDPGVPRVQAVPEFRKCPKCRSEIPDNEPSCAKCGYTKLRCQNCGALWPIGGKFCSRCGYSTDSTKMSKQ